MTNNSERIKEILDSSLINKEAKLEDILKLSEKLAELSPPGEEGWTFISEHYVYKDDKPINPGDLDGGIPRN